MTNHVKVYMKHFGYAPGDFMYCEIKSCGSRAVDVHHLVPRSKFGSKRKKEQDHISNLVGLCRKHHDQAHADREFNDWMKRELRP